MNKELRDLKVNFLNEECWVYVDRYENGQMHIQLISNEMPFATASVAINYDLGKDEVAIKNYSENTGIVDALIEANIIRERVGSIFQGYVQIPIFKLSKEFINKIKGDDK